jgi:single-strand DNA-binding protein
MSCVDTSDDAGPVNQVLLRGRLADAPILRNLPSGDVLAVFRVTVPRPPGDRARVDSIECATVRPKVQRTLGRASAGDSLEVVGSLHRRFWRTPAGPASRYAVDVESIRLIRSGRKAGA